MTTSSDVTIIGNLTRDPELRFTTNGQARVNLGVAVNRRYQQNGEWVEQTSFFNVTAWATLAENAAHSLTKGSRVVVSGRLDQRTYTPEGKGEDERRSIVEIVADDIAPSLRWATVAITRNERIQAADNGTPATVPAGAQGAGEDPFGDFK